jgi:hypothetical protein
MKLTLSSTPIRLGALVLLALSSLATQAQHDGMHGHDMHHSAPASAAADDTRTVVHFPPALRTDTLRNMRDHLLALQQMQEALARNELEQVARIAENRLGMSSLKAHGAHHVAGHMPPGMQQIGSAMHRSASQLANAATEASASGDLKPVLSALATLTSQCVACHSGYRLE